MQPRILLQSQQLHITSLRLCKEILENSNQSELYIIGLQPRGVWFAQYIYQLLQQLTDKKIHLGKLDITFYRDDFRTHDKPLLPLDTDLNFDIENKNIILIDDVFYTGRSVRSAFDALLDFGRPNKVELMVLVYRKYQQHLPIKPDYKGIEVDTIVSQKVKVEWEQQGFENNCVWILEQ